MGMSDSNDIGTTGAPRSFDSAPRLEECKCLLASWWRLQVRRFECFENCAKRWNAFHLNGYTLLRKPRGLEGLALWQQKRHLVPGMRYLRDDNAQPAFYSFQYGQTFPSGSIRHLPKNSNSVQPGSKWHSQITSTGKPKQETKLRSNLTSSLGAAPNLGEVVSSAHFVTEVTQRTRTIASYGRRLTQDDPYAYKFKSALHSSAKI